MKIWLALLAISVLFAFFAALWKKLQAMRAAIGIPAQAAAPGLTGLQKIWLWLLGLKTPICSTLGTIFLFVSTENNALKSFNWDAFLSHDKAVILGFIFWAVGLWTHFTGLQQVAAMPPVNPPAPPAGK
ncbi:MAG: hypothetical protein PHR16_16730 [Methylovulum sp.]|nr:hypothetical protein [Methylovulum sp.]